MLTNSAKTPFTNAAEARAGSRTNKSDDAQWPPLNLAFKQCYRYPFVCRQGRVCLPIPRSLCHRLANMVTRLPRDTPCHKDLLVDKWLLRDQRANESLLRNSHLE